MCNRLTAKGEPLKLYSNWFRQFYSSPGCFDVNYENTVELMRNVENVRRGFLYHECTQLGLHFAVTPQNGYRNIFPPILNHTYYSRLCHDVFGDV